MAAEEANDPERDMPRGIITAMTILLVTGCTDAVQSNDQNLWMALGPVT